ncbi:MAG: hypothetical protein ACKOQ4_14450 [Mycobacterium sp.]
MSDVVGAAVSDVVGAAVSDVVGATVSDVVGATVSEVVGAAVVLVGAVVVGCVVCVLVGDEVVCELDEVDELLLDVLVLVFEVSDDLVFVFDVSDDLVLDSLVLDSLVLGAFAPSDFLPSEVFTFDVPLMPTLDSYLEPTATPGWATVSGTAIMMAALPAMTPTRFQSIRSASIQSALSRTSGFSQHSAGSLKVKPGFADRAGMFSAPPNDRIGLSRPS